MLGVLKMAYPNKKIYFHPSHEPRKYWKWNVEPRGRCWRETSVYIDDEGYNTRGELEYRLWNEIRKEKIENKFIEV